MVRVKICGFTSRRDVMEAAEAGADALGFVLAPSPRRVSIADVGEMTRGLPPFVTTVAVVADPSREFVGEITKSGLFDAIQFHGAEPPELLSGVPLRTIKAFGLSGGAFPDAGKYLCADWFLFDSGSAGKGGTGECFDWSLLRGRSFGKPFILAGGLGPENVVEAIITVKPAAVDLNSGIEKEPGVKDHRLMRQALCRIRRYETRRLESEVE